MPNVFNFTGASGQSVTSLFASQGLPGSLYFSCWVRIQPENAAVSQCIASIVASTNGTQTGYYDLLIQDNVLSIYWTHGAGKTLATTTDTAVVADGSWHQVGFNAIYTGLVGVTQFLAVKDGNIISTTLAGFVGFAPVPSGQYGVSVGCGSASGAGVLNGMVGNILVEANVLNPAAVEHNVATSAFSDYITSAMIGIPRVDANTWSLIELLPKELTSGKGVYIDLASNLPLSISAPGAIIYTAETYLDGVSELTLFAPTTPFPNIDGDNQGATLAMVYLLQETQIVTPPTLATLRARYSDLTFNADATLSAIQRVVFPKAHLGFTEVDFLDAKQQFKAELMAVYTSLAFYSAAVQYFDWISGQDYYNINAMYDSLAVAALPASAGLNVGDTLSAVAGLLSILGPEGKAVGALLKGTFAVANFLSSDTAAQGATYPLGALQASYEQLANSVSSSWQQATGALSKNISAIVNNWGSLSLVQQYWNSKQFNWPVGYNQIPPTYNLTAQTHYIQVLLTQNYSGTVLTGFSQAIQYYTENVPSSYVFNAGNSFIGLPVVRVIGTVSGSSVVNSPSSTVADYVFGSFLNVSSGDFFYQWPWSWTTFEIPGPTPPI